MTGFQMHFEFLFGEILYNYASFYGRNIVELNFRKVSSFFRRQLSRNPYTVDMEIVQIIQKDNIRTVSRRDSSSVIEAETFCRIQCRHPDRRHRIQSFFHADPEMVVQMSFVQNGLWLAVIGTEQTPSAVFRCHAFNQCTQIMAGRSLS